MSILVSDARKNFHIILKDFQNNITKVINTGDFQIGFSGNESSLILTGGVELNTRILTNVTSYTINTEDLVICVNANAPFNLNLPANPPKGKTYIIKDIAGNAGTFAITLVPSGDNLIDDAASASINQNYDAIMISWNGNQWSIISNFNTGGGGGAPTNASYVTITSNGTLTAERTLTLGTGVEIIDNGANSIIVTNIKDNIAATISGSKFTGNILATAGLTGSLQRTTSNLSYLVASTNTTITSQSNGQISISMPAFTTSGTFRDPGNSFITTGSVSIDTVNRAVSTIGSDVFFFASGSINANSTERKVSVFGGDVVVSGSAILGGITGSIQKNTSNQSYLVGSSNISVSSQSNGQIVISTSISGSTIPLPVLYFSQVDSCISGSPPALASGNTTGGLKFSIQNMPYTISGVRFFTKLTAPGGVIRCRLWNSSSVSIAVTDINVSGPGVYVANFGTSSYTLRPQDYNKIFTVSVWITSTLNYTVTTSSAFPIVVPFANAGHKIIYTNLKANSSGDTFPSATSATENYCVEPFFNDHQFTGSVS